MTRRLALLSFALLTIGCASAPYLEAGEGFVEVPGGKVWYRIVGSGTRTPLLVLHGGPGATSYTMDSLADLATDRPVVFYDQLGCGRSDRPDDTRLWTVERAVQELTRVREALGLDRVHLLGHSWGTMLAAEYWRTGPPGIRSLIMASPALNVARWVADAQTLRAQLPPEVQAVLDRHEREGTINSPEYLAATMEYYRRFLFRMDSLPDELLLAQQEFGQQVYETMWGPNEFTATGNLSDFDAEDVLPTIDVPTLFTAGRYDGATPETTAHYRDLVPDAQVVLFENSAHLPHFAEREAYLDALRAFLKSVEAPPRRGPRYYAPASELPTLPRRSRWRLQ